MIKLKIIGGYFLWKEEKEEELMLLKKKEISFLYKFKISLFTSSTSAKFKDHKNSSKSSGYINL